MSYSEGDESEGKAGANPPICSFCKKAPGAGVLLVEGPIREGASRVTICSDCVELCATIIENQRARGADEAQCSACSTSAEIRALLRERVDQVLATLTEAEREVIKLVNGLSDGCSYTHDEIALRLRIPTAQVAEIEATAIAKLQAGGPEPGPGHPPGGSDS